jgi:hypothetical protein
VPHPDDSSQVVQVQPPLGPEEVALLAGLAGAPQVVRRLWAGQPGPRSPWLPCERGCCLVLQERVGVDAATWLRFLVKELLAPQARAPKARAEQVGLPGGHRLAGRVLVGREDRSRVLAVAGRQVRVINTGGGDGADGSWHN